MNYNYVEEKVDALMIDRVESKYPGAKDKVSKTSKHSKRIAIASILGNREIFELIKKTQEKQNTDQYLTYLDELVILFRKYVEVADVEKKTLGEVMTPIWLVEDMLNTLPSDVWSNPNLKWLDPCAGVGTFPSIVVQRLMKGLENLIPNPEKRYGHIIENMLYVCELQDKNLFVFNCVFDINDTNALNTYCGSFLDEKFDNHMTNVWGVEKFDIVIGNPPYQKSNDNKKSSPIWHYFVIKSFDILKTNGLLSMVHPDGWRRYEGKFKSIQNLLKDKEMLYLEIHNKRDGIKTFGAKTTYDFYCVRNTINPNHITKIKCIDGTIENINLINMDFIPNGRFEDFKNLISLDPNNRVKIMNDYSYGVNVPTLNMSKTKTETHKFPCVYSVLKDGTINSHFTNNTSIAHFGIPKVIWSNGSSTPFVDLQGEYGLTQHAYAIVDDIENLENIRIALTNPKFLKLISYSDGSDHNYNHKAIALFRKDFYKQFLND